MASTHEKLLIIWHSRTGASEAMAKAASKGAGDHAVLMAAADVTPDHIIEAAAYLFVCPENLASMSGLMKEMFDRNYYAVQGKVEGRAYATLIAAGSDGEGAQRQIDRIAKGWRLKRVADPLIVNFGAQTPEAILAPKLIERTYLRQCRDLGTALGEGVSLAIF